MLRAEEKMEIKVQKLGEEELKKRGVFAWPIWEKDSSRFDPRTRKPRV